MTHSLPTPDRPLKIGTRGSPLALAAAMAVLDVIESEQLCQRAEVLGARLCACLHELEAVVPQLADVRALGAMVAAEFLDPATRMPDLSALAT